LKNGHALMYNDVYSPGKEEMDMMKMRKFKKSWFPKAVFAIEMVLPFLFFLGDPLLYGQPHPYPGYKYFKNYTYLEYDHHPQNWCITQDKQGIIYIGNRGGVLIFDGVTWKVITVPNMTVHSLAAGADDRIYIGGQDEIGYLNPDARGTLRYVSLTQHLDPEDKGFSYVWSTVATPKGVYFRTTNRLFRWNYQKIDMHEPNDLKSLFFCAGKLWVQKPKIGLLNEENGLFTPLPGDSIPGDKKLWLLVPYDPGPTPHRFLMGTQSQGFFIYNAGTLTSFETEAAAYLQENKVSHGIRLAGGDFAVATLYGGIVLLDPQGRVKYMFNKSSGLQDNNVKYVYEDRQGNLWLALANGIARLENQSPFYHYDERCGLDGTVLAVTQHKEVLYAGTTQGIYVLYSKAAAFTPLPGPMTCWDLLPAGPMLLAAAADGIYEITSPNRTPRKIIDVPTYRMAASGLFPAHTWCATGQGLTVLAQEGRRWLKKYSYPQCTRDLRDVTEDPNGRLWLVTAANEILKAEFPTGIANPVFTGFNLENRTYGEEIYTTVLAGHVVFATGKGIYRYDEKNNTLIPDPILGPDFVGGPQARPVFRIVQGSDNTIWFHSESRNFRAIPTEGGAFQVDNQWFRRLPLMQVNAIYPEPGGKNTWFAGAKGLIRMDGTVKTVGEKEFPALIRRVWVNGTDTIFGGFKTGTGRDMPVPVLSYRRRNIGFRCAASFFEKESATRYRYFLAGYDHQWSGWTSETRRHYTNLDAGRYTFRVQARNIYGDISREDAFSFRVLSPWYRTWWAYCLYAAGLLFLFYQALKWRSRQLVREKERLEQIVAERTREVKDKNDQLERQTLQLQEQSGKLKEMDQIKSRFFANISHEFRTPLTLAMSPLEQLLSHSKNPGKKKMYRVMLRNLQMLLTFINQLLDLSRLDSGKLKLQTSRQDMVSFLKGVIASFTMLAEQKQLTLELIVSLQPSIKSFDQTFSKGEWHPRLINPPAGPPEAAQQSIFLNFDAGKMEEVMYNLLGNAVKFTPPGGKVIVSTGVEAGPIAGPVSLSRDRELKETETSSSAHLKIVVQDTGPGIPQDQLDHIFDRFYQGGYGSGEFGKGTGIGLALTKEFILLHQGKIEVHSTEGNGAEFIIRLPMDTDPTEPGEISPAPGAASGRSRVLELETPYPEAEDEESQKFCDLFPRQEAVAGDRLGLKSDRDSQQALIGSPRRGAPGRRRQNEEIEKLIILVVEDHPDMRRHLRELLEPGYRVIEAVNGREGITRAKEIIPDLIVSDIMMPEIDGYELCRSLKKDIATSHIPIILLTAKASEESVIRGLGTGADDYVTKPFNANLLAVRIKNLIDLRRQLQLKIQREKMLLPAEVTVSSQDDLFLKEFQRVIEENLDDPELNIDVLCQKLIIGRATLYRKIQALTGEAPNQFIQSYRLERSAQMLRENYGNVTEVAFAVGFSSSQYFATCFKEKFHQSPKAYQLSFLCPRQPGGSF
jgi:signal transduction histidine kinase/DNA-binding NarL/FixJ family response regulator